MERKSILENLIEVEFIMAIATIVMSALVWAAEKEVELGIDGMSSERILVREELKNR